MGNSPLPRRAPFATVSNCLNAVRPGDVGSVCRASNPHREAPTMQADTTLYGRIALRCKPRRT